MRSRQTKGDLQSLISYWRSGNGIGKHFTAVQHTPPRRAKFGEFPERLDTRVIELLRRRGIEKLYTHQTQAIELALGYQNPVIVTPTASGKSLCYSLPVLDGLYQGGAALFLFPTKALSQDQTAELNELLRYAPGADDWEAQVYDGDTPPDVRRRIRRSGRLIVTNPDMLHAAILPHHAKWASFFRNLKYIVVDEIHTYRGVFGSHVANVFRRLNRICAHYGANPVYVATSATIANPKELADTLTGQNFSLVDENGAPASDRYICFLNPPIKDMNQMRRQSALSCAGSIAQEVLRRECGTIVFTRSRQSVEIMVNRLKSKLKRGTGGLHHRVASYRGGYLPDLRRSIERGLRDGSILGVISTNALELGIDIGSLDVCVLAGYPGTVASTWQQIGRAGRTGSTSLAVVIASDEPLDQFIVQHPNYFFERSPESARIDPDNLRIVVEHLKCACYELPWTDGEAFGGFTTDETEEILVFLQAETHMVQKSGLQWNWCADAYPASEVNLRNIAEENFVVIDISKPESRVLAEVDFESAHTTIYPNAVYQVSGEPYRVERLDYDQRRAYVRRSDDGYYTTAMHYAAVAVLDRFGERDVTPARIGFGEVCVTDRFVGYKKIKFGTGENVGYGELNLPELDLHTTSYWLELPTDNFPDLSASDEAWARIVSGLGQVLRTAASLKLMCDPRDLQVTIGSITQDRWLSRGFEGVCVRERGGEEVLFGDGPVGEIGPVLYDPTIFIYDKFPGGVGFGEGLFESQRTFMSLARDLVLGCECESGCPSCAGPPEAGHPNVKAGVVSLLDRLTFVN